MSSQPGLEDGIVEAVQFEVMQTAMIDPIKMDGTVPTSAEVLASE
jgi:hypothetical protein